MMNPRLFRRMIYLGIFFLASYIFVLFAYLFAKGHQSWLLEIVTAKILFIPLIVYIIILSFGLSLVLCIMWAFSQKYLLQSIQKQIKLVKDGKEIAPIQNNRYTHGIHNEMMRDLMSIQKQLNAMTLELQVQHQKQELLQGESREEILEKERHRLARELHDSVSQQLFAAMMIMSALNEMTDSTIVGEKYQQQIQMVAKILTMAQSEMRALLLHLRPISLEGKSLKQGIEQLLSELHSKVEMKMTYEIEDIEMPTSIENELFRVIQELLSNTLRHAKADELEVYLSKVQQQLNLRLIDDGIGFDLNQPKAGSYGLLNVKERIASIGGNVKIISIPKQGTSIEIKVPLVKNGVSE